MSVHTLIQRVTLCRIVQHDHGYVVGALYYIDRHLCSLSAIRNKASAWCSAFWRRISTSRQRAEEDKPSMQFEASIVVVGHLLAALAIFRPAAYVGQCASYHRDRKSTRLNSSHDQISYAVFC